MNLKFSHVDILVSNLDKAVANYRHILDCVASETQVWSRDDFQVEFVVMFHGEERFFFVHPISGKLKDMLEEKGDGTIYRLCYTSPDVVGLYYDFESKGVQPENEIGQPISRDDLNVPGKTNILWLPQVIGSLSIEVLEEAAFEQKLQALHEKAS